MIRCSFCVFPILLLRMQMSKLDIIAWSSLNWFAPSFKGVFFEPIITASFGKTSVNTPSCQGMSKLIAKGVNICKIYGDWKNKCDLIKSSAPFWNASFRFKNEYRTVFWLHLQNSKKVNSYLLTRIFKNEKSLFFARSTLNHM